MVWYGMVLAADKINALQGSSICHPPPKKKSKKLVRKTTTVAYSRCSSSSSSMSTPEGGGGISGKRLRLEFVDRYTSKPLIQTIKLCMVRTQVQKTCPTVDIA